MYLRTTPSYTYTISNHKWSFLAHALKCSFFSSKYASVASQPLSYTQWLIWLCCVILQGLLVYHVGISAVLLTRRFASKTGTVLEVISSRMKSHKCCTIRFISRRYVHCPNWMSTAKSHLGGAEAFLACPLCRGLLCREKNVLQFSLQMDCEGKSAAPG